MLALSAIFAVVIGTSNAFERDQVIQAQAATKPIVSFAAAAANVDEGKSVDVTVTLSSELDFQRSGAFGSRRVKHGNRGDGL